jgi:RNA polymerase sigma-70 factor (ECF subfamily)
MNARESAADACVRRVQSGDRDAVEALLREHLPAVEAFVRRHVGKLVRAQESPSDVAQSVCREVLERLADGRVRLQGEAAFRSWLYRAAVLKMMSRQRHWQAERRDPGRVLAPAADGSAQPFVEHATPSRAAAMAEEMERLAAALSTLSEQHRDAILLHHVEGLSHREIGRRLGVDESHSRVLLSRALARLAGALGHD